MSGEERLPTPEEISQAFGEVEFETHSSSSWYFDSSVLHRRHYQALADWYRARGPLVHYCRSYMGGGVDRHYFVVAGRDHERLAIVEGHIKEPVPRLAWRLGWRAWRDRRPNIYV